MGKIRVLPDRVANQIAAGEVVERPASVVKELLENSLDAGATELKIDVESGGRRLIRVADNGSGMIQDDAMLAFERHATSKLREVNDLLAISTLGFRGEALPSIGSVSRLVLETRPAESQTGTLVEIAGSKMLRVEETALARGTTIAVRDLFFNVPARRKFLRSEQTELAHIAGLVTQYSLAHPDKSFRLRHGTAELLDVSPVEHLRDRVFQVFGSQIMDDLVELSEKERPLLLPPAEEGEAPVTRLFRLRGFVSQPQVQKLNRNSIYLFVNGRLIRDKLLQHALSAAYHNLIPPASYPFAVLFLECDAEEVDVNVHPSKTEVRFRHSTVVHDFVRDAIREELMASRPAPRLPVSPPRVSPPPSPGQQAAHLPYSEFSQSMENQSFALPLTEPLPSLDRPAEPSSLATAADLPEFLMPGLGGALPAANAPAPSPPLSPLPAALPASEWLQSTGGKVRGPVPDTHGPLPDAGWTAAEDLSALRDLRVLGQIHDSFIIAAGRDGLWIIDQHVAHERILFEQVLARQAAGQVERQQLLMPMVVELTASQQIQYARIEEELRAVGFDSEPFGARTIAIQAAPAGLGAGELEKVLFEILEIEEREMRQLSVSDLRRSIAATVACRAAIKINTRLEETKMRWMLQALAATEYPMSCPHGRPIALRYGMREILRGFHRI